MPEKSISQPNERHAQIALGGVDEYQNAHDEQGDADDQSSHQ